MTKERQSNFELLRIVSLFMIMGLHANFNEFGRPSFIDFITSPVLVGFRVFMQALCEPSVFVFMMISGYFGIKPKVKSIINLLFMLLFWKLLFILKPILFDGWKLGLMEFIRHLNPFDGWFISAYLGVMLFSPIANKFAECIDKRAFRVYLFWLFGIIIFCDHILPLWNVFDGGYSMAALLAVYILGRYIRYHGDELQTIAAWKLTFVFVIQAVVALGVSAVGFVIFKDGGRFVMNRVWWTICSYTSPMAIAGSISLFLLFSKITIQSRLINHLALSAFPVIGFHYICNYGKCLHYVTDHFTGVARVLLFAAVPVLAFCMIVLIDQIRIVLWKGIEKYAFKR